MMKEKIAAIIIGLIMILSIAGFAFMSTEPAQPQQGGPQIDYISNTVLTPEQKVAVLRAGRVLVEDLYPLNCTECATATGQLRAFAQQYGQFLVLETAAIPDNATRIFQMIGSGGQIRDLQNISIENDLMNVFCEIAVVQPRDCLLRNI